MKNPYAQDEVTKWKRPLQNFIWNDALAMAAQHVAQIEGPCQTTGDANGDGVEEVLAKYYAYDYRNL